MWKIFFQLNRYNQPNFTINRIGKIISEFNAPDLYCKERGPGGEFISEGEPSIPPARDGMEMACSPLPAPPHRGRENHMNDGCASVDTSRRD